jgi:hypothetical protein
MDHGRRMGRGVDARILAAAHRAVFSNFVSSVTLSALIEGMRCAVAVFLPTSRVVSPEGRKASPIVPVLVQREEHAGFGAVPSTPGRHRLRHRRRRKPWRY